MSLRLQLFFISVLLLAYFSQPGLVQSIDRAHAVSPQLESEYQRLSSELRDLQLKQMQNPKALSLKQRQRIEDLKVAIKRNDQARFKFAHE